MSKKSHESVILSELRQLLSQSEKMPVDVALRLIGSILEEHDQSIRSIQDMDENLKAQISDGDAVCREMTGKFAEQIQELANTFQRNSADHSGAVGRLTDNLKTISGEVRVLSDTAFMRFSLWAERHPKQFRALLIGLFVIFNLWTVSGFRALVLEWLNLPQGIINLITFGGQIVVNTPTPYPTLTPPGVSP